MERVDVDLATTAPHPALRRFVRYYSHRRIVPGDDLQEPVTARLGGLFEFHFKSLYSIPIVGTDRFGTVSIHTGLVESSSNISRERLIAVFNPLSKST